MAAKLAAQVVSPLPFLGADNGQDIIYVFFTVTPSGNYAAGGDVIDFTALGDLIKSGYAPINVAIQSQSSAPGHSGYVYGYRPGAPATLANGKFQVLQCAGAGNPLLEIGAGAYPAGVLGDTIVGIACFVRV